MNERYLFRGKSKRHNQWLFGYLQEYPEGGATIKQPYEPWPTALYESVDPATVGQSTGLYDKNEMLIFEGDILSDGKICAEIVWMVNGWTFSFGNIDTQKVIDSIDKFDFDLSSVIGNIHDGVNKDVENTAQCVTE